MGLFLDVLRITEENTVCMHMKIDMPISAVKLCCA